MLNKTMDEFNELYGLERKPVGHDLNSMDGLIFDEYTELNSEIDPPIAVNVDVKNVIKEAIDIIYITAQQLRERGVDVDAALAEVHRSNMSKALECDVDAQDQRIIAEVRYPDVEIKTTGDKFLLMCGKTGKVIKPTTYSPAVITKDMY